MNTFFSLSFRLDLLDLPYCSSRASALTKYEDRSKFSSSRRDSIRAYLELRMVFGLCLLLKGLS